MIFLKYILRRIGLQYLYKTYIGSEFIHKLMLVKILITRKTRDGEDLPAVSQSAPKQYSETLL